MEIIDCICEKCGNDKSYKKEIENLEYGECTKCGDMTYYKRLAPPEKPLVRCPYCNSYKVEKISTMTKAAHAALFGVLSFNKISKEWHCKNCKSDF